jgi:hypothetical protein
MSKLGQKWKAWGNLTPAAPIFTLHPISISHLLSQNKKKTQSPYSVLSFLGTLARLPLHFRIDYLGWWVIAPAQALVRFRPQYCQFFLEWCLEMHLSALLPGWIFVGNWCCLEANRWVLNLVRWEVESCVLRQTGAFFVFFVSNITSEILCLIQKFQELTNLINLSKSWRLRPLHSLSFRI